MPTIIETSNYIEENNPPLVVNPGEFKKLHFAAYHKGPSIGEYIIACQQNNARTTLYSILPNTVIESKFGMQLLNMKDLVETGHVLENCTTVIGYSNKNNVIPLAKITHIKK